MTPDLPMRCWHIAWMTRYVNFPEANRREANVRREKVFEIKFRGEGNLIEGTAIRGNRPLYEGTDGFVELEDD